MSHSHSHPKVFFELTVDGKPAGRTEMELFYDITPRTAENFRALCTGEKGFGKITGKRLHFKGTCLGPVKPDYMVYGGAHGFKNGHRNVGESIYGGFFDDENFSKKHDGPGILSMVNHGDNTNGSAFMILLREYDILDGEQVVFGQVAEGLDLLKGIAESVGDPSKCVEIADCGEVFGQVFPKLRESPEKPAKRAKTNETETSGETSSSTQENSES